MTDTQADQWLNKLSNKEKYNMTCEGLGENALC